MPGLIRRGAGLGGSKSGGSSSGSSSGSSKHRKAADVGSKDSSAALRGAKAPPMAPKQLPSRALSYAKPQRSVNLLDGAPCFLSGCPSWIKSPTLWAPRLSPKLVECTTLGFGRHGSQVLLVRHRTMGCSAVVKQFARDKLLATTRLHDKVLNEWLVHSALVPHPHIVPLYGAMEDKSYVALVMEAQSGDLLSYLDEQDREVLDEAEARRVAADLLTALAHMHDMGFVHRDVKPENLFAAPWGPALAPAPARVGPNPASTLHAGSGGGGGGGGRSWRLGDLGSAVSLERVVEAGAPGLQLEGTPPFLAPEYAALWVAPAAARTAAVLRKATSAKQDIWGVGALLYDMLVGHPPFSGPAFISSASATSPSAAAPSSATDGAPAEIPMPLLAAAIMHRDPSPAPAEAGLSPAAADFISLALCKAPEERPTAAELLAHPWLAAADDPRVGTTTAGSAAGKGRAGAAVGPVRGLAGAAAANAGRGA